MTERTSRWSRGVAVRASIFVAAIGAVATASACDDEEDGTGGADTGMGGEGGAGTTGSTTGTTTSSNSSSNNSSSSTGAGMLAVDEVASDSAATPTDFSRPFDAASSPDGTVFYFTGYDPQGEAGVFRRNSDASGPLATLFAGAPLAGPFGLAVSSNGGQLFIADPAAVLNANDPADVTKGVLFSMPAGGGTPSAIMPTAGFEPRGVEVADLGSGEKAIFTGKDKATGEGGVFDSTGSTIFKGAPLMDPSGIAIAADDKIYVTDTQDSGNTARVFVIDGGVATMLVENLTVGYPAGAALTTGGDRLFVSGVDPTTHTAVVYDIDIASKAVTPITTGVSANDDSGGLHRALNTNTFAWAGINGGPMGTGTIYRITLQ